MTAAAAKSDTLAPARRVRGRRARGRRSTTLREGSARVARQFPLPWPTAARTPAHHGKNMSVRLWERVQDDRDLIGLKTTLLVSLVVLAAVLEWVI